jgi:hypothetical protein
MLITSHVFGNINACFLLIIYFLLQVPGEEGFSGPFLAKQVTGVPE